MYNFLFPLISYTKGDKIYVLFLHFAFVFFHLTREVNFYY